MGNWALTQTAVPSSEPVTVTEAKQHARIDTDSDDIYVSSLVTAARSHVETLCSRQLITATYELRMDKFYDVLLLPRPPLQSVTSIEYVDTTGSTVTLNTSKYKVDSSTAPARITPAWGETWPTARDEINAVTITYDAGYGDNASDVPADLIHAIKLMLGHLYENREQVTVEGVPRDVPRGVQALVNPYDVGNYGDIYPGYNE